MTDTPEWATLVPEGLALLLAPVNKWINSEPDAVLPSYRLGTDGPSLSSVFCVYGDLLCEVRVANPPESEFDFVRKDRLVNLRVERSQVQVGEDDDVRTYNSVSVTLLHFEAGFRSKLNYIGDDPDSWLRDVRSHFGIDLLTGPS